MTRFSWDQAMLVAWTLFTLIATSTASVTSTAVLDSSEEQPADFGLTAWLNSLKGGYFNPKQEIRRENPDDPTSILGIFANEQIFEGELLTRVPWNAIIGGEEADGDEDVEDEDEDEEDPAVPCGTARNLAKELKLGKDSRFGPYVQYLLNQPQGQLPSAWSPQGKALLATLLGGSPSNPEIPPVEVSSWLDTIWIDDCRGADLNDAFAAHAFMLAVQRTDDDIMVPVYDLYNHRNGKYYNTKTRINRGRSHEVRASRTIEAGEQLYNSYNLCSECKSRYIDYGTSDILRDYGFVERFPQRWYFDEPELQFDLHEEHNESGAVEYKLKWHRELHPKLYSQKAIKGLMQKLGMAIHRIDDVHESALRGEEWKNVPEKEWKIIWEYKDAVKRAYSLAIDDLTGIWERKSIPSGNDCIESEICHTIRE